MRILLLGADGQVGFACRASLARIAEVVATTRADVDVTSADALRATIDRARPDVVVNAVAWTDVDGAEKDEAGAMRVNAEAPAVLAELSRQKHFALVHYSTDFVFDGALDRAYVETDATNPLSAYGRSKLAGEREIMSRNAPAVVLRTAWVWSLRRKSFVTSILRLARERQTLRVVDDQIGSPTFADDLAEATARILDVRDPFAAIDEARGVYHAAGEGAVSRFDFARAIVELDAKRSEHEVKTIEPVPSNAFPLPAQRPKHAPLDCTKLRERFGVVLPPWRDSLARALGDG